jgi:hypothetical protein
MEPGYVIDETRGFYRIPRWIAGAPERSMWTGLKLRGKEQLEIATYRCRRCGYLESYAGGGD